MNVLSFSWRGQIRWPFPMKKASEQPVAAVCVPGSNYREIANRYMPYGASTVPDHPCT